MTEQNFLTAKSVLIKILHRLLFLLLGFAGTFIIYVLLILIWGLVMAPWIRIVNSNVISFILLVASGLICGFLIIRIGRYFPGKDPKNHDQHQ